VAIYGHCVLRSPRSHQSKSTHLKVPTCWHRTTLQIVQRGKYEEVPEWFPRTRLNYAENLLYRNDDGIACTAGNELGVVTHYTFRQLREMVRKMAAAMRANGLRVGDRVAGEQDAL